MKFSVHRATALVADTDAIDRSQRLASTSLLGRNEKMNRGGGDGLLIIVTVSTVNVALGNALIKKDQYLSKLHVFL